MVLVVRCPQSDPAHQRFRWIQFVPEVLGPLVVLSLQMLRSVPGLPWLQWFRLCRSFQGSPCRRFGPELPYSRLDPRHQSHLCVQSHLGSRGIPFLPDCRYLP
ncbi:hypothetical protein NP493_752g00011 [Ridgeia piscesae]|uniref:Uncharacterized protein n=1 Tax=Ridgeia piscesae TaxID=27915 RepID=A0AAD9KR14_RIDPI|nr:hypothetical protein NP493_752g00011 [Ridgeia piscesae]